VSNYHRRFITALGYVAMLLALFAAWEATKASLGRSLLQVLEPLHAQQVIIAADKFKLEMTIAKDDANIPTSDQIKDHFLPVCLRHYPSPQIREVCGRDKVLARNFDLAHYGLQRYQFFWPDVAGGVYSVIGRAVSRLRDLVISNALPAVFVTPEARSCISSPKIPESGQQSSNEVARQLACGDVEYLIAPVVQLIANYILPFIFGIIGSLLYVILHHYDDVRKNTLSPRDKPLAWLRVTRGIVVAACVSLLVTSYAGSSASIQQISSGSFISGTLAGSLTLSASALTFLAGFGAEAVFTLLQGLVERVFAIPKVGVDPRSLLPGAR